MSTITSVQSWAPLAGVRGWSVTADPGTVADVDVLPGGAVDPPAPHGRTGEHGRVDGDGRGSGVPDDQERAGRAGEVDDGVDGLRRHRQPEGERRGKNRQAEHRRQDAAPRSSHLHHLRTPLGATTSVERTSSRIYPPPVVTQSSAPHPIR
jgi:hypothetical protein